MAFLFDLKVVTNIGSLKVSLDCKNGIPQLINLKKCVLNQISAGIDDISFSMDKPQGLVEIKNKNTGINAFIPKHLF